MRIYASFKTAFGKSGPCGATVTVKTQAKNGYNSLDLPSKDHDICNEKGCGEPGDTGKKSQFSNSPSFELI